MSEVSQPHAQNSIADAGFVLPLLPADHRLQARVDRPPDEVPAWLGALARAVGGALLALDDGARVRLAGSGFRELLAGIVLPPDAPLLLSRRGPEDLSGLADGRALLLGASASGGTADPLVLAKRAQGLILADPAAQLRVLALCRAGRPPHVEADWLAGLRALPAALRLRLDVLEGEPVHVFFVLAPAAAPGALAALSLSGVGPGGGLGLDPLAPRLNLITGDNGLGKSFVLDAAWYSLTGTWAGFQALPDAPPGATPAIRCTRHERWGRWEAEAHWSAAEQAWWAKPHSWEPSHDALVIYALPNNRFAIWDPARSGRTRRDRAGAARTAPPFFHFSEREVLDGLSADEGGGVAAKLCLGLIDEWREWQLVGGARFAHLTAALAALGPEGGRAPVGPGALRRLYLDDARAYPTLRLPHGEEVPILFAPAGYRRMAMLGYLLTWALGEHADARRAQGLRPSEKVVLLIDEPETHLHPRWQRTVLRGLRAAIQAAAAGAPLDVQTFVVTHAPLVLASAEVGFDPAQDALWKLDLVDDEPLVADGRSWSVQVSRDAWRPRGDVRAWLTSDVFDLDEARSLEGERAIQQAFAALRADPPDAEALRAATANLRAAVPGDDPLWPRWSWACAQRGVEV
ncbi:MAG: ATP-binding protein [Deltaproteobacteria bacterium]|nr:ATP-binding protein [Deltaproteobacteria bacterium]